MATDTSSSFFASMADAHSLLIGLGRPLTKSNQAPAPVLTPQNPVPGRLDPSLNRRLTQPAKKIINPRQVNQMPSELYPLRPRRQDFIFGKPSRYIGRSPFVIEK